jgi:hypothetical protein
MANCCPVCKGDITQFLADRWHCLQCDSEWGVDTIPRTVYTQPGPRGAAEITPQSAEVAEAAPKSKSKK